MIETIAQSARRRLDPLNWGRPVFEMELRVSSRRLRPYIIRCVFLAALAAYTALTWSGGGVLPMFPMGPLRGARPADMPRYAFANLLWFQFLAACCCSGVRRCDCGTTCSKRCARGNARGGTALTRPARAWTMDM